MNEFPSFLQFVRRIKSTNFAIFGIFNIFPADFSWFFPGFCDKFQKRVTCVDFQSNLWKQTRNLPKILKSVKINIKLFINMHYYSFYSFVSLVVPHLRRRLHVEPAPAHREVLAVVDLSQIYRRNRTRRVGGVRWTKQEFSEICPNLIRISRC